MQAATRGNGVVGEGILPQVKTIRSVPLTIPFDGIIEVQGEGIMNLSVLEAYNRTAAEPLKNARNAAAGALRNLNPRTTAERKLNAFFYNVGYAGSGCAARRMTFSVLVNNCRIGENLDRGLSIGAASRIAAQSASEARQVFRHRNV